MARKKRKEEAKEEYEWTPPEFDEKAFLEKDITGTKALLVTVLIAVVFGALAFIIGKGVNEAVGFLMLIIGGVALNYIYPLFKIDRSSIDRKGMAGNIVLYILLCLGMWILLMNPPFT